MALSPALEQAAFTKVLNIPRPEEAGAMGPQPVLQLASD
jgi:hypothetical protein